MATIRGFYRRAKKVNIEQVVHKVFESKKDELLEQNKKQLFEGFNSKGTRLRPYRSAKYARVKNEMNPSPGLGNPDYYVTGAFYRGWAIIIEGGDIKNEFRDSKSEELLKRSGDLAGLGGDYKKEFVSKDLNPAFLREIRKPFGL